VVEIKIWGAFPRLNCSANANYCLPLTAVRQWGDVSWTSFSGAFQGAKYLTIHATDIPNMKNVVDMSNMFNGATYLTGDFSGWDTSTITGMVSVFQNATNFNRDVSSWDVSKVVNFTNMLNGATAFRQDLSSREPISATTMTTMLNNTNLSIEQYNALLSARSQLSGLKTGVTFGAHPSQYGGCEVVNADAGIAGRALLVKVVADGGKGWTISD
jgi:hypothetical protein